MAYNSKLRTWNNYQCVSLMIHKISFLLHPTTKFACHWKFALSTAFFIFPFTSAYLKLLYQYLRPITRSKHDHGKFWTNLLTPHRINIFFSFLESQADRREWWPAFHLNEELPYLSGYLSDSPMRKYIRSSVHPLSGRWEVNVSIQRSTTITKQGTRRPQPLISTSRAAALSSAR